MKALVITLALFLTGCASIQSGNVAAKLAVQVATMKVIESDDDRTAKAARIVSAVEQARVWLDVDGVTLADLKVAALRRLQERNLDPSDMLLASALVDIVAAELDVRIGQGALSPEQKVTVNTFLGWVAEAASFYAG